MGREYVNAPFELTSGSPATILADSIDIAFGAEASDSGSGDQYAQALTVTGVQPTASVTTRDLEAVFDNVGINGQCVGSGKAITGFGYYARNAENCNSGALSHLKYSSTTGLLRLGSLTASRGEDTRLSLLFDALSDGTNAPLDLATGATLPTSPSSRRYTLEDITIAGVSMVEVDSVSLDFGVATTTKRPALGSLWPVSLGVSTIRPVLTLSGRELEKVTDALMAAGAEAATHANTSIKFAERASPSGFVSDVTTTHVTLTLYGLHVPQTPLSASGGGEAQFTTTLIAGDDGSNAPVVISTGVAI